MTLARGVGVLVEVDDGAENQQTGVVEIDFLLDEDGLHVTSQRRSHHHRRENDLHDGVVHGGLLTGIHDDAAHAIQRGHGGEHGAVVVLVLSVFGEGMEEDLDDLDAHLHDFLAEVVDQRVEGLHHALHGDALQDQHEALDDVLQIGADDGLTLFHGDVGLQRDGGADVHREVGVVETLDQRRRHGRLR